MTVYIQHESVLKNEIKKIILNEFSFDKPIQVLDGTTGEGGHTEFILSIFPNSNFICLDQDEEILSVAKERLNSQKNKIHFLSVNFSELTETDLELINHKKKFHVILLDLGISIFHYTKSNRGFSFRNDEDLDMRLDLKKTETAADIVNFYSDKELTKLFFEFGEERWSNKIVKKIVEYRKHKKILNSTELAKIIESSIPRKFWPNKIHPATRCFQALRIKVNNELEVLANGIKNLTKYLDKNGIIMIISFHSLEDRIVKHSFRELALGNDFQILTKRPIIPSEEEIVFNPASRSSKLRVLKKK